MVRKSLCVIICFCIFISLCGCWNYRGLNQMAIVSGIAIDKTDDGRYHLSMEVVDASAAKESATKAMLIECEGDTILSAIRDAKRRSMNKLYISHAQVIIVSHQIAEEEGILSIIDLFLRDSEIRETCHMVISQELTAKMLFSAYGMHNSLAAFEISEIIDEDSSVAASTTYVQMYEIFQKIKSGGEDLALTACHITKNDEIKVIEVAGTAVFKGDKLIGYLDTQESKCLLFAVDEIEGGVLTLKYEDVNVTLEIKKSKTSVSFSETDGNLKFSIAIKTRVFIAEYDGMLDSLDESVTNGIKAAAEEKLKTEMETLVLKVQNEYKSDIFGFGNKIYKRNLKLWKEISESWYDIFSGVEVEILPEIEIVSTSLLKKT
ncbi:MAG: Ger(x)C family spore germination protein [Oscillospiraceae bacterium]